MGGVVGEITDPLLGTGQGPESARLPEFSTRIALEDIQEGMESFLSSGALKNFQQQLRSQDPILAQRFKLLKQMTLQATQGLKGLEGGGLPADVERGVLNRVRSTQAARGLVSSGFGAVEEAAQLGLAAEDIRAQRFSQAFGAAQMSEGGVTAQFMPSMDQLMQIPMARFQADVNMRMQNAQSANQYHSNLQSGLLGAATTVATA